MKVFIAVIALFALTACGSQPTAANAQLDAQRDPAWRHLPV